MNSIVRHSGTDSLTAVFSPPERADPTPSIDMVRSLKQAPSSQFRFPWPTLLSVLLFASLSVTPLQGQDGDPSSPGASSSSEAERVPARGAPLTIGETARRALETHPSVAVGIARRRSAVARVDEARASRLPSISLSAEAAYYQEPMVVTPIHGFSPGAAPPFDDALFQGGGHLTYTLFDGGGRGDRIAAAREGVGMAEASMAGTEQEVLLQVGNAYLDVLASGRILDAHDVRLEALEAEYERVLAFLDAGRAAVVERLRVESALADARAQRVASASELETAERSLGRLTGLALEEVRRDRLSAVQASQEGNLDVDLVHQRAIRSNAELQGLRRAEARAEASLSLTRSARWPRLEVGAHYVARGSADYDPVGEWNGSLGLSVPLFTGGEVGSRIERAAADQEEARERTRSMELEIQDAVDRALAASRDTDARRASLEAASARAEEVARIEQLRLETGEGLQSEYLDAEATLLNVRARLESARYAELRARMQIARLTGELTVDWIRRNLGGEQ